MTISTAAVGTTPELQFAWLNQLPPSLPIQETATASMATDRIPVPLNPSDQPPTLNKYSLPASTTASSVDVYPPQPDVSSWHATSTRALPVSSYSTKSVS